MKYLKLIIFAFTILQTTFTFSQQILDCDDEPTIEERSSYESIHTDALNRNIQNDNAYVFNMFFHIIRNDNGDPVPTNENTTLEAIAMLNRTYNQYNIFFKYKGYDYIDNSNFTDVTSAEFYNDLNNTSQTKTDAFNVYIAQTVNGGSNAGKGRFNNTFSVFDDDYFLTASLPHEIAHNFFVLHTHQDAGDDCEHVNGDNCLTAGDGICDTPASYLFTLTNVHNIGPDQYEYVNPNNDTDCIGDVYVNVPIRNFMSRNTLYVNNYYNNLRNHFTQGQSDKMKESIEGDYNNRFSDVQTNFASLYEPYKSEYTVTVSDNVYSVTDNGDGTAEECRLRDGAVYNYFQPGFDYEFSFSSNLDSSFPKEHLPFVVDEGQFRVVKINQIDPSFLDENNFDIANYDNLTDISAGIIKYSDAYHNSWGACETVPFLSAKIITKENLGSPYSQLQELNNQQEASDPNLEQNLETNKFHIIEKTTTTGHKIQKTIYKNEN